jgi:hypothetical protein
VLGYFPQKSDEKINILQWDLGERVIHPMMHLLWANKNILKSRK